MKVLMLIVCPVFWVCRPSSFARIGCEARVSAIDHCRAVGLWLDGVPAPAFRERRFNPPPPCSSLDSSSPVGCLGGLSDQKRSASSLQSSEASCKEWGMRPQSTKAAIGGCNHGKTPDFYTTANITIVKLVPLWVYLRWGRLRSSVMVVLDVHCNSLLSLSVDVCSILYL